MNPENSNAGNATLRRGDLTLDTLLNKVDFPPKALKFSIQRLTKHLYILDTLQNKVSCVMKYQFDEIISAPCRLGILATLVPGDSVSFTAMKAATSLSDGNLHVQTRKLADVGYIEINKTIKGRRSVTKFRLTELGRDRLRLYVMKLQEILDVETRTAGRVQHSRKPDDSAVWA
ncbi:MAG: transcriptional regulator [Xanthomonadales bacterium]|nr:transcriptional regulator [Xanthomonadales bacterium]